MTRRKHRCDPIVTDRQKENVVCLFAEQFVRKRARAKAIPDNDREDLIAFCVETLYLYHCDEVHQCIAGERSKGWLIKVVDNQAIDWYRKQQSQKQHEIAWPECRSDAGFLSVWEARDARFAPEQQLNLQEVRRILSQAVAQLKPQQQILYSLLHQEGKSVESVAAELEKTPGAVYKQHHQLRHQLMRLLQRMGETRESLLALAANNAPLDFPFAVVSSHVLEQRETD